MNKDAYYFPHFSNARNDRKLRRLMMELQIEGYGIYFMILEILRDQENFKYPLEDLDVIADEIRTSEAKVRTVVCNYGLFEVDEDSNFFSLKFNEFMMPYLRMKEQRRIAGKASAEARKIKKLEQPLNSRCTEDEHVFNEIEQSKVKKSKVNESKEENNKYIERDKLFEDFWNSYDKKKDKHKCLLKFRRLTQKEIESIREHLPKYIKSTPDVKYRKNPLTYLNGKCWEDEVIVEKTSFEKTMDALNQWEEGKNGQ